MYCYYTAAVCSYNMYCYNIIWSITNLNDARRVKNIIIRGSKASCVCGAIFNLPRTEPKKLNLAKCNGQYVPPLYIKSLVLKI